MSEVLTLPVTDEPKRTFCRTPTAAGILSMLGHCYRERDMGLLIGAPGVGKTTTLRHYAATERNVWLATMAPSASALVPALTRVAEAIGTHAPATGAISVHDAICRRLRDLGPGGLLLLDEAQHLCDQSLEELRCIHDSAEVGIVIAGNATFVTRFAGKVKAAAFAQLTSRIGAKMFLKEPMPEDIAALCDHHRVAGKKSRVLLERHAGIGGGLRIVGKLIRHAERLAEGRAIELRHLQDATAALGLSV